MEGNGEYKFAALPGAPVVTLDDVEITTEDIPGWQVSNAGLMTVALDVTVTPELRNEGMARELVNRIQNIRKESDFDITDKVKVELQDVPEVREALKDFGTYLAEQVLANDVVLVEELEGDGVIELDIDGRKINARVTRD